MTTSADGAHIWGLLDAGASGQLIFHYDRLSGKMRSQVWTTTPPLLPRVSVAGDGSWALVGWSLYAQAHCDTGLMVRSRYPGATASSNVAGHAADPKNGLIYAQINDSN